MLGCPNPQCEKPKYTLGPRPDATVRPFRGLTNHRATFTSLEVSPPRPMGAHHIYASPEASSAEPSAGLDAGELRLFETPIGRLKL